MCCFIATVPVTKIAIRHLTIQLSSGCLITTLILLLLCHCLTGVNATEGIATYGLYDDYATVTFTLRLRRMPLYYVINLIIPCGLLSLIAVTTFMLQPSCTERLGLGE